MTEEQRKSLGLLSTSEVAEILGVVPKTVLNRRARLGCGVRLGRDWFFTARDVETLKAAPDRRRKKSNR